MYETPIYMRIMVDKYVNQITLQLNIYIKSHIFSYQIQSQFYGEHILQQQSLVGIGFFLLMLETILLFY